MHVHPAAPIFKLNCKKILWAKPKVSLWQSCGRNCSFVPTQPGKWADGTKCRLPGDPSGGGKPSPWAVGASPSHWPRPAGSQDWERRGAMPGTRGESVRGVNRGANAVLTRARLAVVMSNTFRLCSPDHPYFKHFTTQTLKTLKKMVYTWAVILAGLVSNEAV